MLDIEGPWAPDFSSFAVVVGVEAEANSLDTPECSIEGLAVVEQVPLLGEHDKQQIGKRKPPKYLSCPPFVASAYMAEYSNPGLRHT
jgi:hypothetical protein